MYKTMPRFPIFLDKIQKMVLWVSLLFVLMFTNSVSSDNDWIENWTTIRHIGAYTGGTCYFTLAEEPGNLDCPATVVVDCNGSQTTRANSQRVFDLAHSAFLAEKRITVRLNDENKDSNGRCYAVAIQVFRTGS